MKWLVICGLIGFAACGGSTGGSETEDEVDATVNTMADAGIDDGGGCGDADSATTTLVFCQADFNPCTTGPAIGPECPVWNVPDGTPCNESGVCVNGVCQ